MVSTTFQDPEVSEAVIAAIVAGRKIEAIKLVRIEHGLGLVSQRLSRGRAEQPRKVPVAG